MIRIASVDDIQDSKRPNVMNFVDLAGLVVLNLQKL